MEGYVFFKYFLLISLCTQIQIDRFLLWPKFILRRGHPYTTWSAKGGGGVDEMTMNDHEGGGEGSQNDHVVTWTEMYFASDQKMIA